MMTWREMEQLAIDTRTCFMCKAKAHEPCRTKSGRLARYTHATRVWPIH